VVQLSGKFTVCKLLHSQNILSGILARSPRLVTDCNEGHATNTDESLETRFGAFTSVIFVP
jgi:hypothetical protein